MAKRKEPEYTTHESFGSVTVMRHVGNMNLFQSPHRHDQYISIKVYPAEVKRDLSHDYIFSGHGLPYLEFAMSEAQWAHMVSSHGSGSGTPVTLRGFREGKYHVCEEPALPENRRDLFARELDERATRATENLNEVVAGLKALLQPGSTINKTKLKELFDLANYAQSDLTGNLDFVMDQHKEDLDRRENAARTEIESHALAYVEQLGLRALATKMVEGDFPMNVPFLPKEKK